jgi:protein gp37
MSIATKIQWCDSTCNPTMGCEGCELWNAKTGVKTCYAGMLHVRFGGVTKGYSPTFEELTFWPGRMAEAARWRELTGTARKDKPWLDGLPRLIFVSDMSDALSATVPFDFLEEEVVRTVTSSDGQRHQWLWLTKRPDRMAQFSIMLKAKGVSWPENLWAGTSITTQATTSRIKHLLRVGDESTIRFLSVEPQREVIALGEWLPRLGWIIQGGESGRGANPFQLEWAHDLIGQCREAGVACFLKQLGSTVLSDGRKLNVTVQRDFSRKQAQLLAGRLSSILAWTRRSVLDAAPATLASPSWSSVSPRWKRGSAPTAPTLPCPRRPTHSGRPSPSARRSRNASRAGSRAIRRG